jgi:hypothetical protein
VPHLANTKKEIDRYGDMETVDLDGKVKLTGQ